MKDSVSGSTRATYNSGYQAFLKFNRMNNLCDNVSESTLMQFVTYCYDSMHLSYQTIKIYLCGIDPLFTFSSQKFTVNYMILFIEDYRNNNAVIFIFTSVYTGI